MPVLDRILAVIDRLFLVGANAALFAMLLVTALNVASRAFLGQGVVWAFPISIVCFVWMSFLGFFVVYRQNKDITVVAENVIIAAAAVGIIITYAIELAAKRQLRSSQKC